MPSEPPTTTAYEPPWVPAALKRIAEIDAMFEEARGWGSWMVMCANERENLVDRLNFVGIKTDHKWQARCDGRRTD